MPSRSLLTDESGLTAVEYSILLAGVALIIVGGVVFFGQRLTEFFKKVPELF